MKCDRCGDDKVQHRVTLRNPFYDDGTFQRLKSVYRVCKPCHRELQADDNWKLR